MPVSFPDRPTPISPSDFESSFGGTLICAFIAILLYGVSVLQAYMYSLTYPKDTKWIKLLVIFIMTLETIMTAFHEPLFLDGLHSGLITHNSLYTGPSLFYYGNPSVLDSVSWPILGGAIGNYLIIVVVQTFFIRMIYHLMKAGLKKYILMTGFALCILGQYALGICWVVKEFQSSTIADILPWVPKLLVPVHVHQTIIIYAINRLALTTIVGSVQTILHLINPHNISALSIDYIAVHLYVNSFLAALNARNNIRGNTVVSYVSSSDLQSHGPTNVNLPGIQRPFATAPVHSDASGALESAGNETSRRPLHKGAAGSVNVETESYVMGDLDIPKNSKSDTLQCAA